MYTRELTFHNRVRTVYGPVDSWEQELDLTRPETLPPDSITLTCDELRLNEDPVAARAMPPPADGSKRPIGPDPNAGEGQCADRRPGAVARRVQRAGRPGELRTSRRKRSSSKATRARRPSCGGDGDRRRFAANRGAQDSLHAQDGEIKVDGIQYFEITPERSAKRAAAAGCR